MSNSTAKTITTNIVPVQGTFEPLPPYDCISLIGPAGTPFFAPVSPILDGVTITNSTINSTTIGATSATTGAFTTATATNAPSGNNDLCNKIYVDSLAVGIQWKEPVVAATTVNITLSGAQTIDTVSVVAGDRVLVKNQTNAYDNGIYVADSSSWSRSTDANTWDELVSAIVFVEQGNQGGSAWYCYAQPGGTLGVTAVPWSNLAVSGVYYAGTGLSLAGNTFSITNTGVSAATYGSASAVPVFAVNAQGQLTSVTNTSIAIAASAITSGTIDSARISGSYTGITAVGTLSGLTVSSTIVGSISGNAATATSATTATTATNLAGGASGNIPYQTGSGATSYVSTGTDGQYLVLASGVPTWTSASASGDVTGPASSTDNAIARFDSTTGKIIQNSAITLSDAGALQNVNEINFDVTPTGVVGGAGSLAWNSDDNTQTLDLTLIGGAITCAIGQNNFYRVKASSAITKGQVVMFTGTVGASGGILAAPATGLTALDAHYVIGLAAENIALNGWGYVTEFGEVAGINTTGASVSETWVNGDILWLNSAVAGGLTKVTPTAPAPKVQVAAVVYAASNGILFVRPTFDPALNQLSNVYAPSPSDNDLIVWDNTDARWESRAPSSITAGLATSLAGGATGSLPYQSATNTTTFLAAGTDGQVLKLASGVPTWSSDVSGVTITDDTTTNATRYITFSNVTTGNETTLDVSSTKLQFNPSTGVLTTTGSNITGLTASSAVATDASNNLVSVTNTGSGNNVLATSPTLTTPNIGAATATSVNGLTISSSTGTLTVTNGKTLSVSNTLTLAGTDSTTMTFPPTSSSIGYLNIPQSGSDKTTSYTLALGDIGEFVGVGSGGSITIPNSTFAAGDAVSIFNNTTGNITITCTITTAYIAGTDTDKATVTLATRGVCTVLFISGTVCVLTGNVS
jgi:hypothetical protein